MIRSQSQKSQPGATYVPPRDRQTDRQLKVLIFRYLQTYRLRIINRSPAPSWSSSSSSISTLSLCGSFSSQPKQSCRIGVREGQAGWLSRIHPTDRPTHYRPHRCRLRSQICQRHHCKLCKTFLCTTFYIIFTIHAVQGTAAKSRTALRRRDRKTQKGGDSLRASTAKPNTQIDAQFGLLYILFDL